MAYNKVKREKVGQCNLCLEIKKLSWDHVPPKAGIKLNTVEIRNIYEHISGKKSIDYHISQNGVKYRTVCSACNSKLGYDYDPTLNNFNATIATFLKSTLILPPVTFIETKPVRLIKAILGHLVAAKPYVDKRKLDEKVRKLIFSDFEIIPDDINIFYWVYPYDTTTIMRDFFTLAIPGVTSSLAICDLLKYFPVGFLVTDSPNFRHLDCLTKFRNLDIDAPIEIRLNLRQVEDYDWPERVDENNLIGLSDSSQKGIIARRRP